MMKKRICAWLLAGLLLLTAAGCKSLFEDEYYHEEPATGGFGPLTGNATEIRNFSMLKTALTDMISRHEEQREFRLSNYNGNTSEDLAAACFEIKSDHPLGAYAVENISYDTSYVVSYYMANIYISYKRTSTEVGNIVYALSQNEFDESILQAVEEFQNRAVVRLYSSKVDEAYIRRLVRQHYFDDPVTQVTEPQITVTTYPTEGTNRIYDVTIGYGATQALNMALSLGLSNHLHTAVEQLTEQEPLYLALECAEYLSRSCADGETGDYPGTAYGALVEHAADSKGMALAYLAMCRRLDIPCIMVEGVIRTMGMEPHFWNIITLDGANYHVDVSALAEDPAKAFLCDDDAFWGTYIWETEEYPVCDGTLTYGDAAQLEPEPPEEEAPAPEEGEAPDPEQEPAESPAETPAEEFPEEETAAPAEAEENEKNP